MFAVTKRRFVVILFVFLFSLLFFSIPSYLLYINIKGLVVEELGRNARNVAVSIADLIEEDISSYETLTNYEDYSDLNYDATYYNKMIGILNGLNSNINADYIYTIKYIDDQTFAYILDAEDTNSEFFSPIGSTDVMTKYERLAFSQGIIVITPLMDFEPWGVYLTGYAPIMNNETSVVVGLVGVDFSLSYVANIISSVRLVLLLGLVFLVSVSSFLLFKFFDIRMEALNKDYLTGLYSKRYQESRLRKAIKEARAKNNPLSVIMLDVDYFKEINDNYGHYIGDKVLKSVGNAILYNTRNVDICSRYGGDEFLVILPNTLPEEAAIISDKIMKSILRVEISEMKSIPLSFSVGIALWDHVSDQNELITQADKAMYVSKNTGKNKLTIYK
jgi:diguanylate cyclase (GGDEF)-like protein